MTTHKNCKEFYEKKNFKKRNICTYVHAYIKKLITLIEKRKRKNLKIVLDRILLI